MMIFIYSDFIVKKMSAQKVSIVNGTVIISIASATTETSLWPLLKINELVINSALLLETFN